MAVFMTKDKKEIIVTCKCGCMASFHIAVDDSEKAYNYYALMCFLKDSFETEQYKNPWQAFKEKLRKIWLILVGKDYRYSDTLMSKDEFEIFKEYINQF